MLFCGFDIGTTSTKAVLLDDDGQVIDEASLPAPEGPADAMPVYWHEHLCRIMDLFADRGRFAGQEIACSVTGQGGSFVLADHQYRPVSGACSWTALADTETVADLTRWLDEMEYYHKTGWPPHGWLAACKLKQMVEQGRVPREACCIATVPDFIYAQLLGGLVTDITSAQISGLADFPWLQWSREILEWVGIDERWLPEIATSLEVLAEEVETPWGDMTLVTGSHDQYAAMEAAGLEKDTSVMLGTGTAWVIDGRTSEPLFDDERFLIHPGQDLRPDCYGLIVTLWQIGAGFDKLLKRLRVPQASLAELEETFARVGMPQGPIRVDLDAGTVEPTVGAAMSVRRYMEWAGSTVAHALDGCGLGQRLEKIVATGGAMASRFWPQVIADVCGLTVEAVEYPPFTAYGAALHAREALLGSLRSHRFPDAATVRTYSPRQSQEYQAWYRTFQQPMLESLHEPES